MSGPPPGQHEHIGKTPFTHTHTLIGKQGEYDGDDYDGDDYDGQMMSGDRFIIYVKDK